MNMGVFLGVPALDTWLLSALQRPWVFLRCAVLKNNVRPDEALQEVKETLETVNDCGIYRWADLFIELGFKLPIEAMKLEMNRILRVEGTVVGGKSADEIEAYIESQLAFVRSKGVDPNTELPFHSWVKQHWSVESVT